MASRAFFPTCDSLNERLTMIQGSVTFGASGAVASITGTGVASVSQTSTGIYKITLSDAYARCLGLSAVAVAAASGTAANVATVAIDADPQSSSLGVPAKQLSIQTLDAAAAKVDPASGSVLLFMIWLRNSSIKGAGE